jgi:hypothetical protein
MASYADITAHIKQLCEASGGDYNESAIVSDFVTEYGITDPTKVDQQHLASMVAKHLR